MALNLQTLKTRSLTAVVFVAVMLVGLLWNFWSFLILVTVVHFGCWYEFVKLMKKIYGNKFLPYCLFGLIYITMPVLMLIDLWMKPMIMKGDFPFILYQYIFPCIIIFSIWINDTMAYVVGSLIGKTPFSKISPKKTWEGTIGGAILCVVAMYFIGMIFNAGGWLHQNKLYQIAIIAALCAIFGTIGDLFESKLKRMAGVKDSGSIMPGHGGFLDRFDSLLFAAPIVWVYVKLFM
jgi:phosphatidate cytidylyltransferase